MKAKVYINENVVGTTNLKISDESMGGIIGELVPNENYNLYKSNIQSLSEKKGIANCSDFDFILELDNKQKLNPEGGIGISDFKDFNEIIIESAGNSNEIMELIKNASS